MHYFLSCNTTEINLTALLLETTVTMEKNMFPYDHIKVSHEVLLCEFGVSA